MQKKEKKHHPCKLQSTQSSLYQFKVVQYYQKPESQFRILRSHKDNPFASNKLSSHFEDLERPYFMVRALLDTAAVSIFEL